MEPIFKKLYLQNKKIPFYFSNGICYNERTKFKKNKMRAFPEKVPSHSYIDNSIFLKKCQLISLCVNGELSGKGIPIFILKGEG